MIPGGSSGGQLPRRNDLTLVLILDELLHGFRVEDFDVLHDRRIGFAALLHEGVNVTLGLPIIRASVDHGTDFYHAGKGNGNELSLVNAIKYAVKMTGRAN